MEHNRIVVTLKNGEKHIFKAQRIEGDFFVHLCEKCNSEINLVYNVVKGCLRHVRYRCEQCGYKVIIHSSDIKKIED